MTAVGHDVRGPRAADGTDPSTGWRRARFTATMAARHAAVTDPSADGSTREERTIDTSLRAGPR